MKSQKTMFHFYRSPTQNKADANYLSCVICYVCCSHLVATEINSLHKVNILDSSRSNVFSN